MGRSRSPRPLAALVREPAKRATAASARKASPRATAAAVLTLGAFLLTGCAGAATPPPAVAGGCVGEQLRPTPANATAVRAATLCLLNAERERHGLSGLIEDDALRAAADAHSLDMARRDYFEHDTPEGIKPWMRITRAGYRAPLVGENLAWGEEEMSTPAHAMELWMASPGHRDNLLEPRYTQVGVGLAFDAPDPRSSGAAAIYTTTFGSAAVSLR